MRWTFLRTWQEKISQSSILSSCWSLVKLDNPLKEYDPALQLKAEQRDITVAVVSVTTVYFSLLKQWAIYISHLIHLFSMKVHSHTRALKNMQKNGDSLLWINSCLQTWLAPLCSKALQKRVQPYNSYYKQRLKRTWSILKTELIAERITRGLTQALDGKISCCLMLT